MLKKRILYFLLFVFCLWLALATRNHKSRFHPVLIEYGGDVFWAGGFLFFLRAIFAKTTLWKLACWNFALGVLIEVSQLYHGSVATAIRGTTVGKLLFGLGFLWSDIICYAAGTLLCWLIAIPIEKYFRE